MQESNEVQNNKSNNQSMGNDDSTQSWHLLSLITWIFFIITIWASYHNQILFGLLYIFLIHFIICHYK